MASAPNAQRQNTTVAGGCPKTSTGHPTVPEMVMARIICTAPRVVVFMSFPSLPDRTCGEAA